MKRIKLVLPIIAMILLWSCGNTPKTKEAVDSAEPQKIEIITKSYSVNLVNGDALKDTVNMIQSMVVDENGKELANKFYNLDGSVSWTDEYEFDDKGNKNGSKFYDSEGKQTIYYEYDQDSKGRRVAFRAKDINTDTLLYDGASKYFNNGTIRRDGYVTKSNEFKYNLEYQFDKEGKELGYIYIDLSSGDKFPSTYTYTKFAKDGKWSERQIIENEKVTGIEAREFKEVK